MLFQAFYVIKRLLSWPILRWVAFVVVKADDFQTIFVNCCWSVSPLGYINPDIVSGCRPDCPGVLCFTSLISQFYSRNYQANWFKAQEICGYQGLSLASINSKAENDLLEEYLANTGKYIFSFRRYSLLLSLSYITFRSLIKQRRILAFRFKTCRQQPLGLVKYRSAYYL